ncbi:MAG: hypothetical protein WA813_02470 [Beijerinckiaceae bacterium]
MGDEEIHKSIQERLKEGARRHQSHPEPQGAGLVWRRLVGVLRSAKARFRRNADNTRRLFSE